MQTKSNLLHFVFFIFVIIYDEFEETKRIEFCDDCSMNVYGSSSVYVQANTSYCSQFTSSGSSLV